MPNNTQQRSQHKLRRLLLLIDCMSQLAEPKTAAELAAEFGSDVCMRSMRRDLDLLTSMKLVFRQRVTYQGPRGNRLYVHVYSINHDRTRSLAESAKQVQV